MALKLYFACGVLSLCSHIVVVCPNLPGDRAFSVRVIPDNTKEPISNQPSLCCHTHFQACDVQKKILFSHKGCFAFIKKKKKKKNIWMDGSVCVWETKNRGVSVERRGVYVECWDVISLWKPKTRKQKIVDWASSIVVCVWNVGMWSVYKNPKLDNKPS